MIARICSIWLNFLFLIFIKISGSVGRQTESTRVDSIWRTNLIKIKNKKFNQIEQILAIICTICLLKSDINSVSYVHFKFINPLIFLILEINSNDFDLNEQIVGKAIKCRDQLGIIKYIFGD